MNSLGYPAEKLRRQNNIGQKRCVKNEKNVIVFLKILLVLAL